MAKKLAEVRQLKLYFMLETDLKLLKGGVFSPLK